jgi:hypothetical protein
MSTWIAKLGMPVSLGSNDGDACPPRVPTPKQCWQTSSNSHISVSRRPTQVAVMWGHLSSAGTNDAGRHLSPRVSHP